MAVQAHLEQRHVDVDLERLQQDGDVLEAAAAPGGVSLLLQ